MAEIRWVARALSYNQDNENLQNIIIYPQGVKKEEVKREHSYHTRDLLIPEGERYEFRR